MFGAEHEIGGVELCTLARICEAGAGGKVILESEHQHRAYLECVGVTIQVFQNKKLVGVLCRLRVIDAYACYPLAFWNKSNLFDFSLEHFLGRSGSGCRHEHGGKQYRQQIYAYFKIH